MRNLVAVISFFLIGCEKKLEKPKVFQEEIKFAKRQFDRPKPKSIEIPKNWKNKVEMTLPNYSSIEIIKKISENNCININFADELQDKKIFFSCSNLTALEAIKKVCELANFRISIQNEEILISKDIEYDHFHEITFLSNIRNASTNTNINAGYEKTGLNIGSSMNLNSKHDSDIWQEIELNLNFILGSDNKKSRYTINKQAGLLIVRAPQKKHKQIHDFLCKMHQRAASQVLIETKILSVNLHHSLKTGINWNSLNLYKNFKNKADWIVNSESKNSNAFKVLVGKDEANHDEIISLLENFGEVTTVSNPTTTVLNNQYAVFKVAENQIFFNLKQSEIYSRISELKDKNEPIVTFTSEVNTVPVGTTLSVQPSIDFRNRNVTLFLHPIISEVIGDKADPAIPLMVRKHNSNVESTVPIVSTQEMDSTIRVEDGNLVIIGGLIKKSSEKTQNGIPGVRKLPILGKTHTQEKYQEIVIMLRAYIIDAPISDLVHSTKDYELFKLNLN